jgi:hypothetical protein
MCSRDLTSAQCTIAELIDLPRVILVIRGIPDERQSMQHALKRALAGALVLALAAPVTALAQDAPSPATSLPAGQPAPVFTQKQLDQILAPVALYPDPLLTSILTAATYPLEVVQAARRVADPRNAQLKGDALTAALANQPWDPSVTALVPFPQVLKMLDSRLDWMQQLGDAFLSQQAAVMDSVQRLRQEAEAAGKLQSTPQQVVSNQDGAVVIAPADPDEVYVPAYDPSVVYGSWPYPDYPPVYIPWWSGDNYGPALGAGIVFGAGIALIGSPWFFWGDFDWRHHHVRVDPDRFNRLARDRGRAAGSQFPGNVWQHDPAHRRGVAYRDLPTRERFQPGAAAVRNREERLPFRGHAPPQQQVITPGPGRPNLPANNITGNRRTAVAPAYPVSPRVAVPHNPPPAFTGLAPGAAVRAQSARGAASLRTVAPPRPAPVVRAPPRPAPVVRAPAPPPVARAPVPARPNHR